MAAMVTTAELLKPENASPRRKHTADAKSHNHQHTTRSGPDSWVAQQQAGSYE